MDRWKDIRAITDAGLEMLRPGIHLNGKWTGRHIVVKSLLGQGANGQVYSILLDGQPGAMKVAESAGDVAFEWHLLTKLQSPQSAFPQPLCIDDALWDGRTIYFYVMERIDGQPLSFVFVQFTPLRQREVLQEILLGLKSLHHSGHAFIDIKPENIMIAKGNGRRVRFVDVGGIRPFHQSVRQFTPLSDRAYWGYGTRESGVTYDVAAVALMMTQLLVPCPKDMAGLPVVARKQWMTRAIARISDAALRSEVADALSGQLTTTDEWIQRIAHRPPSLKVSRTQHRRAKRKRTVGDWTERVMWVSIACAATMIVVAWGTLLQWFTW